MIEQALRAHLQEQETLTAHLATYANKPAVFNQEAPSDKDSLWATGPQYGRIVFSEDIQGDPERTMGGMLAVDIQCKDGEQFPEEIEPIIRQLIHGYFFSSGTFVVAAQWKNSAYFTEPTDHVVGCTVTFDLLGFPIMTTSNPDVIARINEWTSRMSGIHVINYDKLPSSAWKPDGDETAVYWRVLRDAPANWIPDTFQTIWRTATIKGHIFSADIATASAAARRIRTQLYASRRLIKAGESPIMVNRNNTVDDGADPLRTGQMTVEATYGEIIFRETGTTINHINKE